MQEEIDEQREREAKKLAEDLNHKMEFIRRFNKSYQSKTSCLKTKTSKTS